jgi:hypothetical protein
MPQRGISHKRVPNSHTIGQVVAKLPSGYISVVDILTDWSIPAHWSEAALVVQEFLDVLAT